MEHSQFYLVIGSYFQQKDVPGLGFDQQYSQRAVMQTIVENTMFSGVIDMSERIGAFQDRIGNSDIEIISLEQKETVKGFFKEKLSFAKTYEGRMGHTIYYQVFTEGQKSNHQEWFGKWKYGDTEGLVRLWTIENKKDFSDWRKVSETLKLLHFLPEDEIPITTKKEVVSTGMHPMGDEGYLENEDPDDLSF